MTRSWQLRLGIALICTITSIATARAQNPPATATKAVPRSVPFSGQLLTPKGEARTGAVMLTFGLYGDQKDSAPIWIEQHLVTLDGEGRYSVILGSTSAEGLPADAFAAGTPRWMGVQVEGETEQPRMMLLSVPYALKAGDADTIAGKPATEFVLSSNLSDSVKSALKESKDATSPNDPTVTTNALVKYANSGGTLTESSTVDVGGRVGIQVASPLTELDIAGFGSGTTVTLRNGAFAADAMKMIGADGSLRIGSATTANMINLIGNNIGLRTVTPGFPLTFPNSLGDKISLWGQSGNHYGFGIQGSLLQIHSDVAGSDIAFGIGSSGAFTENLRFTGDGHVGIGTASPSGNDKVAIVAGSAVRALNGTTANSVGEAIRGACTTAGDCWAIFGTTLAGGLSGNFVGGRGLHASSSDDDTSTIDATASGTTSYGVSASSGAYRALHSTNNNGFFSAVLENGSSTNLGLSVVGATFLTGNLSVSGSKSGYVVDAMQNLDSTALEPGDVVVIVGNSAPVTGEIPVVTVRKATSAYDSGVAGVVDQALYVPDAATKAAYDAQQEAMRAASAARAAEDQRAHIAGAKPDYSGIAAPKVTIADSDGVVHATLETSAAAGSYVNVVTLGSYKMIKVDASFGAIHAGDLLTTSTNPGYAMKVSDKAAAIGAIVGKALGDLESGTGTIPVMVMPR